MNPYENPFSPGAGSPPPELAGRKTILDRASLALERVKRKRSEKSFLLIGLRGVGKTVLLHRISELAEQSDYKALMVEASENKSLPELIVPYLRQLLYSLDMGGKVSDKVKRALRVLKSFMLKVGPGGGVEFGVDIDAEKGTADSGDLEADLSQLFIALGEAAQDRSTAIAVIIDEMQYLQEEELGSLIMAIHKVTQKSLPIVLIGAGLPQLRGKAGNAKSYAERLFDYPEVGPLSNVDAKLALQEPVRAQGVVFSDDALEEILRVTEKYPYFIQEWGYQSWLMAKNSPITVSVVKSATIEAIRRLDQNFFGVRFDRLTPKEKEYLRAMAELGSGAHRSGDIAERLGKEVQSVAPVRNFLIKKGMIYSPTHGDTEFTVPLFVDFMKRIMPVFPNTD
ncbi:MAG TPA: ATP-binding protein [Patescibacteria group bacterium]|nr:AAA family ATPase [Bdellovibrionales bacterium]HLE50396.1 ATP-binding protein [Patescibacteria group bacterium]